MLSSMTSAIIKTAGERNVQRHAIGHSHSCTSMEAYRWYDSINGDTVATCGDNRISREHWFCILPLVCIFRYRHFWSISLILETIWMGWHISDMITDVIIWSIYGIWIFNLIQIPIYIELYITNYNRIPISVHDIRIHTI